MRVLMLGWMYCKPHQLTRYVDMYEKMGASVCHTLITPAWHMGTYTGNKRVLEYEPTDGNGRYDLVHSFCAGSLTVNLLMQSPTFKLNFNRIIYDSGPMFPSGNALVHTLQGMYGFKHRKHPIIACMVESLWKLEGVDRKNYLKQYSDNIFRNPKPKLYVNSEADRILQQDKLKKYIDNSTNYEEYWFDASRHVRHHKHYPDEYEEVIYNFVKPLLKIENIRI